MHLINRLLENIWVIRIIKSSIVIAVNFIFYRWLNYFLFKNIENRNFKLLSNKKTKTYIKLVKSVNKYIIIILTILVLLQINGINISSMLAGLGIISVVFGLAIQDWLKDIIRGSSIISDNYFAVGDVVKYKDIEGKVLVLGMKTTKIQNIRNNNVLAIANRNIEEIEVISGIIQIRIPMPYEVSVAKAEKVVEEIVENVKKNSKITDCKYKGVAELADSSIQYLIEVRCNPTYKLQAERDTLKTILLCLENNKISVPYNQIDVHQK